ncbi:uncharacterized protein [Eleutherodactylus coqui]|uniref:uncharacterized protein n=1 Tax=Eleutherodactylus coqui TaxID=57060 RepID=UPI003462E5E3
MPRKIPQTITLPPQACVLPAVVARIQEEQVAVVSLEPTYYLYADEEPQKELKDFVQKMCLETIANKNTVNSKKEDRVLKGDENEEEEDMEEPSGLETFMDDNDSITETQEEQEAEVCPDFAYFEDCSDEEAQDDFKNCWEEMTQEEQVAVVSLEPTYYLYADEEPQKELKDFVQKIFFSHSWLQYTEDNRVVYNRDDDNEKDSEEPSYYEAFMDEADDITVNEDEEEHSYNYAYLDDSDIDLDKDEEVDMEEPSGLETFMDDTDSITEPQEEQVSEVCPDFAYFEDCSDEEAQDDFKNCWEEIFEREIERE